MTFSDDNGLTWDTDVNGRADEITDDVKLTTWGWQATGPVHSIQINHGEHAGRLVIPVDHIDDGPGGNGRWGSHLIYSDDHGETWTLGALFTDPDSGPNSGMIRPNETTIVELNDGRIFVNSRDHGSAPGNRSETYSSNIGVSFDSDLSLIHI